MNKQNPIMVTGATGYVAGQLIKKLLEQGLTVHATVRNPDKTENLKYLNAIADKSEGKIKYFKADLLENNSFDQAIKGCEIVFHTASPFIMDVKDPQQDLVAPALLGTRNVLESVNKEESVKRVVVTSSCAAIYGDNAELEKVPNGVLTEEMWNTTSTLAHNPYSYSKTVAELEAWKMHEQQNRWQLITINPSLVMGPGLNPYAYSESYNIIKQFGDGTMRTGVPNWELGVVDVRDVAQAHFQAAFSPEAKGRYIICGHNSSFPEMAEILQKKYGAKYPIPKRVLPKWLLWILGPLVNKSMTRRLIARNVNYTYKSDNSKSKKDLDMNYRPLQDTMHDFFEQLVTNKVL